MYTTRTVILLGLAAGLLIAGCQKKTKEFSAEKPEQPIINLSLSEVNAIKLEQGSKKLALVLKDGKWSMQSPDDSDVDSEELKKLWQTITRWQGRPAGHHEANKMMKMFEHSGYQIKLELTTLKNQSIQFKAIIDQDNHKLKVVEKDKQFYTINESTWTDLDVWRKELSQRQLLPFQFDRIEQLIFRYQDRVVHAQENTMGAFKAWEVIAPKQCLINKEAIADLETFIENSRYLEIEQEWVWGKTVLSRYGLQRPAAQLTIWMKGERVPRILKLAKPDEGNDLLFAKFDNEPKVYSITPEWLQQADDYFSKIQIEKEVITWMDMVTKIETHFPNFQRQLLWQNKKWASYKIEKDDIIPYYNEKIAQEEAGAVIEVLNALTYYEVIEEAALNYETYQDAKPYASIKFYTKLDEPLICLDIFKNEQKPDYLFLKNDSDGKVMSVESDQLEYLTATERASENF